MFSKNPCIMPMKSLTAPLAVVIITVLAIPVSGVPSPETGFDVASENRTDHALPRPGDDENLVTATLLTESASIRAGGTLLAGIRLEMEEGWYVYWKNPGDSGIPTSVSWSLPGGYTIGELLWPWPGQFYTDSFVSYGYKEDVILFAELGAPADARPGDEVELSARVVWLVCKDICIPGSAQVGTKVQVSDQQPATDPSVSAVFDRQRRNLPVPLPDLQAVVREEGNRLLIDIPHDDFKGTDTGRLVFYCEQEGVVESGAEQYFETTEYGLRISLRKSTFINTEIREISGVLYNANGWGGDGVKALQVSARVAGSK